MTASGRPIVWVADGSHASYFWPGQHPLGGGTEDVTASSDDFIPVHPQLLDVTAAPAWMTWDGFWGQEILAGLPQGTSPRSPGVQPAWDGFTWEPSAGCTTPPSSMLQSEFSAGAAHRYDQDPSPTAGAPVHCEALRSHIATAVLLRSILDVVESRPMAARHHGRQPSGRASSVHIGMACPTTLRSHRSTNRFREASVCLSTLGAIETRHEIFNSQSRSSVVYEAAWPHYECPMMDEPLYGVSSG